MQIAGIVRPSETRETTIEAEDYQDGLPRSRRKVPDGWQLIQIKAS